MLLGNLSIKVHDLLVSISGINALDLLTNYNTFITNHKIQVSC